MRRAKAGRARRPQHIIGISSMARGQQQNQHIGFQRADRAEIDNAI